MILADYGMIIAAHLGLALTFVAATVYAVARAAGLTDLRQRVERSIRHGEVVPEFAVALRRDNEGEWELT